MKRGTRNAECGTVENGSPQLSIIEQSIENKAIAIRDTKNAAAALVDASEKLRAQLDALDACLRAAAEIGCSVSQETLTPLFNRITKIRQLRNGMECFELGCRVNEAMETAWEALPR